MPQNNFADFVETENIARYKTLLETETHPDKRQILIRLLADEEVKHAVRIAATNKA